MEYTNYRLQTDGQLTIIRVISHLGGINFPTFIDNLTTYLEMNILEKADFIL